MIKRLGAPVVAAAAIIISIATGARAQSVPLDEFTPYNPANAASITPGIFSLYSIPVDSLSPTQFNVGFSEVGKKTADWNLVPASQLQSTLLASVEPVVIGPGGQLYQINGHHTFDSLAQSIYGASNPTVYVNVVANYSSDTPAQFLAALQTNAQVYPFNNGVLQTLSAVPGNPISPIPTTLTGLTNDPYRGLEFQVLKNKGAAGIGVDKTSTPFSDFLLGNAYRNAVTAHGTGLPYLTPADANAAAAYALNGSSLTSLPGLGSIAMNKMPGFILPGSVTVNGTISNATLANGELDGSNSGTVTAGSTASFNGINGYSVAGTNIVPAQPGFVMQLGADKGGTVTLAGPNTYTGGTTIMAGTLVAANDAALGAAPSGTIDPNNVQGSVQSSNGIVFNSLTEGNGTLRFGTTTGGTFNTARNIAIGQETANFDMNGNTVTLTGNIASFSLGEGGLAALTVNDNTKNGTLVLAPSSGSNPLFYGNLVISNGTLKVSSDAAMGAVVNPGGASVGGSTTSEIGQIDLDGGTFKAGAGFSSVRSLFLTGSSTYDTNGVATSFSGGLTDTQRSLSVINSGATAGSVAFGSLTINATATLGVTKGSGSGAAGDTSVTLTNGIIRGGNATLFLAPKSGTLGTKEAVFSSGASTMVTNGMVAPWIVIDSGGGATTSPYSFATYGGSGYVAATAASTNIATSTATQLVTQSSGASLSNNGQAYALSLQSGNTITIASGKSLTLGDGTNPAGLILNNNATITGGTLAFGGSEAVIYVKGSTNPNTIASTITGSGGLTLSGSGILNLNAASNNTGATVIDSGTLSLNVTNALAGNSNVTLEDVKSSPSNSILQLTANNTFSSLNSTGNNSSVVLGGGVVLTIGDANNLSSTLSSGINDNGSSSSAAGAITKAGSGLVDLSGGSSGKIALNAASTIVVSGGQLRLSTNQLANGNGISLAGGTELQLVSGGGGTFASNITGGGLLHLESGVVQLTGSGNTWSGGTTMEVGTFLVATTSSLSSAANQTITNAGSTLVLDQTTTGNFTAVMTDGQAAGTGPVLSGSFVKSDSTGANGGNVTITNQQQYSGATTVEAGTLTLGTTDAVRTSSGVTIGTVGGGSAANLALGADNTVQGLNSVAGNTTGVRLSGHALTVQQTAGAVSSFGGNISDSGAGSVNTTGGGGTLALSGTNSVGGTMYTGAGTTISQTGGSLSVAGNVTNNGTFAASGTTANFGGTTGTFTNNGTITSDPSTLTFNNLTITPFGSIQASLGDVYDIGGDFLNTSTQGPSWNTKGAGLDFYTGGGTGHMLQLTATDGGDTLPIGRASFVWGSLTINAGNTLTLEGQSSSGYALYVDDVIGAMISGNNVTNIIGDGFNIYYDPYDPATAYLDGLTYNLVGGGVLTADVPEPASMALLLSGLAGTVLVRRRATRSAAT